MSMMDELLWGLAAVTAGLAGGWLLIRRSPRRAAAPLPTDDATSPIRPALSAIEPIEDRIAAQLSELDRLIDAADEEIARLEAALADSRSNPPSDRPLSCDEQQRSFAMWEAGFDVEEIAECLMVAPERVRETLDQWRSPDRRAA
jgi:hypothetical protein